jgi:LysM repeat protein
VPPAGLDYTIQAGDTLGVIGARYGLTWQQIAAANGLEAYSILEIGQVIRLPGVQGTGSAPAAPLLAPTATSASVATGGQTTAPAATTAATGSYVVQPGDTLWSIAVRHNTTWQALAAANGMSENDFLVVGRTLAVPGQPAAAPPVVAATPQPTLATRTPTTASLPLTGTAVVAATATPTTTLRTAVVTAAATPATTATAAVATATPAATAARVHVVVNGDSIIGIANRYGVDWQQLLQLNGLTESSILQIGQQIRLE